MAHAIDSYRAWRPNYDTKLEAVQKKITNQFNKMLEHETGKDVSKWVITKSFAFEMMNFVFHNEEFCRWTLTKRTIRIGWIVSPGLYHSGEHSLVHDKKATICPCF